MSAITDEIVNNTEDKITAKSSVDEKTYDVKNFWVIDIFVLVFFITTAITGLYLFRRDLMKTIEARDTAPIGAIIIKNNIVQRRHEDRTIWDRLYVDSLVYSGDLVRAAEISSASIYIDEHKIDLNENTLIRLKYTEKANSLEIELQKGNLSFASAVGGTVVFLNLMGSHVYTSPGTVLNAEVSQEGVVVKVNEGNAAFVSQGQTKELSEGSMIVKDHSGVEQVIPAVIVKRPAPNARFVKNDSGLLPINFVWSRINLADSEKIRLEISGDRSFSQDVYIVQDIGSRAYASFDTGLWHWRLCAEETVLSTGQLTVADGSGPHLSSPVMNSVIRYKGSLPQLRFQWAQRKDASHYIIEVSDTQEFINPKISKQSEAESFIYSGLGEGTWYWRVRSVFPSTYEGNAVYSDFSLFKIEEISAQQESSAAAMLEIEVPEPAPVKKMPILPAIEPQFTGVALTRNKTPSRRIYIVRLGDTLGRIAVQVYGNPFRWSEIAEANDLKNPDLIFIDQMLFLP